VRGVGIAVVMTEIEIEVMIEFVIVEQLRDAQIRALDDEWVLDLSYAVYIASPRTSTRGTRAYKQNTEQKTVSFSAKSTHT
jgi:hypothetical protein